MSEGRPVVRAATGDDAAVMLRIHYASVRAIPRSVYPGTVLAAWAPEPDARREQWMRGLIESGRFVALLAEREGEPAGFALCEAQEGFLQALYVDPRQAGGGVGRVLLAACERAMREHGKARSRVLATRNAVPFYQAAGYRELGAGTQPLPDGSLLDCVEMLRPLAAGG